MAAGRWFVVASFSRWEQVDHELVLVPASVVHAKEMGSLSTACGIWCETWTKWWEQPFSQHREAPCEDCARVIGGAAGPDGDPDGLDPQTENDRRASLVPAINRR